MVDRYTTASTTINNVTSRFKKGAVATTTIMLIASSPFVGGWVLWVSSSLVNAGTNNTATATALIGLKENFDRQSAVLDKLSTSQDAMKTEQTRQGVIIDLISPQLGVNPGVADAKIKREASSTQ